MDKIQSGVLFLSMNKKVPESIDEYISAFPDKTQEYLHEIRALIHKSVKNTSEKISYGIPAVTLGHSYLIYFSGNKKHIGMYPIPAGDEDFRKEILPYKQGKSTMQFALEKPLPVALIKKMLKWAVKSNEERQVKK